MPKYVIEDKDLTTLVRREWASFVEINKPPDIAPSTLWETAKTVIRGIIISYSKQEKAATEMGQCIITENQTLDQPTNPKIYTNLIKSFTDLHPASQI